MLQLASFSADSLWAFLQIFCRVSALFVTAPVFGSPHVTSNVKIGLSAILSLAMVPLVGGALSQHVPADVFGMACVLLAQVMIGLILAFVAGLVFAAVRKTPLFAFVAGFGGVCWGVLRLFH